MTQTASTPLTAMKPHVSIQVRDLARSIDFYRKMFGVEPARLRTGYAKFDLEQPPLNFVVTEASGSIEQGMLTHLGIQVSSTGDVAAWKARWEEQELVTRDEMGTSCCWAKQDKTWVHDPDGIEWEVFTILEADLPQEAFQPQEEGCCVTTADGNSSCATA